MRATAPECEHRRSSISTTGEGALSKDRRNDARDGLRGRASRYRKYGEALRAFASKLKAPEIRKKLLSVADELCQKAASLESVGTTKGAG